MKLVVGSTTLPPGTYEGTLLSIEAGTWTGPYAGRAALVWRFDLTGHGGYTESSGTSLRYGPTGSHLRLLTEGMLGRSVRAGEVIDFDDFAGLPVRLVIGGEQGRIVAIERRGA